MELLISIIAAALVMCAADYFTSTRFKKWLYKQNWGELTETSGLLDAKNYAKVTRDAKALERQAMTYTATDEFKVTSTRRK